jgi:hypothetical protein
VTFIPSGQQAKNTNDDLQDEVFRKIARSRGRSNRFNATQARHHMAFKTESELSKIAQMPDGERDARYQWLSDQLKGLPTNSWRAQQLYEQYGYLYYHN